MMKIALGTVQWGLNDGISNKQGIPSKDELNRILSFADKSGINLLDTASSYGNSEARIGDFSKNKFNIVTKIGISENDISIKEKIKKSLKKLKSNSVYGCLFHDTINFLKYPSAWNEIQVQKKEGLIKKIGFSLYNPQELEKLFELNYIPDLIQVPFNLIDRRFEPYLKELKNMDIEIHVRSIFLQGLLLNFKMMNEIKFSKWNKIWWRYRNWLKSIGLSPLEACISHVLSFNDISNIVVGVDDLSQLKQIILASKRDTVKAPKSLISTDEKLINPLSWL